MHQANLQAPIREGQYHGKRRHPRYLLSVPITVYRHSAGGPLLTAHGLSIDISRGGVGVVVCGPPEVEETILINVQLLEAAFEVLAIVRHSNNTRSGFEFL